MPVQLGFPCVPVNSMGRTYKFRGITGGNKYANCWNPVRRHPMRTKGDFNLFAFRSFRRGNRSDSLQKRIDANRVIWYSQILEKTQTVDY